MKVLSGWQDLKLGCQLSWIHQLYHEGKSVQDTIDRIYTARHVLYFQGEDIITVLKKQ
ncbi:hypothetical protein ABW636_02775 [Aquimarina sp. 2201CG1-2-11]|uniref:hypothetical protein n=1 Tax=Aquimarina discodermiae TaxID=3231043 RepID=UPI003462F9BA